MSLLYLLVTVVHQLLKCPCLYSSPELIWLPPYSSFSFMREREWSSLQSATTLPMNPTHRSFKWKRFRITQSRQTVQKKEKRYMYEHAEGTTKTTPQLHILMMNNTECPSFHCWPLLSVFLDVNVCYGEISPVNQDKEKVIFNCQHDVAIFYR